MRYEWKHISGQHKTEYNTLLLALTFIGSADAFTAALPHGKAHAAIVAQIVPAIKSSDEGVKVVNRAEWESSEQNGAGLVEGNVNVPTILANPCSCGLSCANGGQEGVESSENAAW